MYLNIKKHGSIKIELAFENKEMMLNRVAADICAFLSDCLTHWIRHLTENRCWPVLPCILAANCISSHCKWVQDYYALLYYTLY